MSIQNILVPVDFSDTSFRALKYAADLSLKNGASITLLHAYQMPESGSVVMINLTDILEKDSETGLDEMVEKLKSDEKYFNLDVDIKSKLGFVDDAIKSQLTIKDYQLLVMGTTGAGNNFKAIFGSNTSKVMKKIDMPIISVPADRAEKDLDVIVAGIKEGKLPSKETNHVLYDICEANNARIYPIHVVYSDVDSPSEDEHKAVNEFFGGYSEAMKVEVNDDPAAAMMEFADEKNADLVVVYRKRYNFLQKLFHTSQSRSMALYSKTPVLIIPFK
jgi:nucleotide-binding universal stress UspA family protein